MSAAESVIELRGVDKAFGEHVVYEGMDLVVRRGETLGIIGGSGEGKSVCLRMMTGLLVPDAGSVCVFGQEVPELDRAGLTALRRRVAMVFQGGALFDSLTVTENIAYALVEHTSMGDDEIRARAMECLETVGLSESLAEVMPANLSGGQRKRVALARSIALKPEIILYDEPTTGLDPENIARIADMIVKLQAELNVTGIVVTHDMPTAFRVSDRIAMLHERRFPHIGTPQEIAGSTDPIVRDFVHGLIEEERP